MFFPPTLLTATKLTAAEHSRENVLNSLSAAHL
jgi:hypothetical protein